MNRGAWHQMGDRSQRLVLEQLENGVGVGAIISPRDLSRPLSIQLAADYRALGAQVLIDQQFYVPDFRNTRLDSYPICSHRLRVSALHNLTDTELDDVASELEADNRDLGSSAVLAPAVVYEAGRPEIQDLNTRLFSAAKKAGDAIGIPTYTTVFMGHSLVSADVPLNDAVAAATSCRANGWYYGFEFAPERIPSSTDTIMRCLRAGLLLASTGLPVLHAYAGPASLLSCAFGATAAAIGHSQNLWRFTRDRWQEGEGQGGGGNPPARFFSRGLWGTIVYPDETSQLAPATVRKILQHSPYSSPVGANTPWRRWAANKHLVHIIGSEVSDIARLEDPRKAVQHSIEVLDGSVSIHKEIADQQVILRDATANYQGNWKEALKDLLADNQDDYDYLDLIR